MKFVLAILFLAVAVNCKKIEIKASAAPDQWISWSTVDKAHNGDYNTVFNQQSCYNSKTTSDAKAFFYIGSSAIKEVRLLNRGDCCPDRIVGTYVRICSGSSCQQCGAAVSGAAAGAWVTVSCEGLIGDRVEVWAAEGQFLQLCEIEIYGEDAVSQISYIEITGSSTESGTWNDYSTLEKAYDGIYKNQFTQKSCYHSGVNVAAKATFTFAKSHVSAISILNRGDCCDERLNGAVVQVCNGDHCQDCGTVSGASAGAYSSLSCSLVGDSLTIELDDWLQLCEVIIEGESHENQLEIKASAAPDQWISWSTVDKAHNGDYNTVFNQQSCYNSKTTSDAKAFFYIDSANVQKVKLLNRGDCCPGRIDGTYVRVCSGSACQQCGSAISEAAAGAWLEASCGGIKGDRVEVWAQEGQFLQLCEIEIFGTAAESTTNYIEITGSSTESGTWNDYSTLEKAYDGIYKNQFTQKSCYHSGVNVAAKATFTFGYSDVSVVSILNRGDCCDERLNGAIVSVCDGDDCQECGVVSGASAGAYSSVKCGHLGDSVTIQLENWLQLCEVLIEGEAAVKIPDEPKKLTILSSSAQADDKNGNGIASVHDGTEVTGIKECFRTKAKGQWAAFDVEKTTITSFRVLAADKKAKRIKKANVEVCDGDICQSCGLLKKVKKGQWAEIECNISGDSVKITSKAKKPLQLCEVEVWGF